MSNRSYLGRLFCAALSGVSLSIGALLISTSAFAQTVVAFESGDLSQANFSLSGERQWQYGHSDYNSNFVLSAAGNIHISVWRNQIYAIYAIDANSSGFAKNSWSSISGNGLSQGRMDIEGLLDSDNDGIYDVIDNCVNDYNPDHLNTDGVDDGGNVCDIDGDNDGVNDEDDVFPLDASESKDADGDGIGNNRDTDVKVMVLLTCKSIKPTPIRMMQTLSLLA